MRQGWDSRLEILYVTARETEMSQVLETFIETAKDSELATEGVLSKEQLKDGRIFVAIVLPVRIRHGYLIQICQKSGYERICRRSPLSHNYAP